MTDTSTNGDIQGKVAKYSKKVTNKNKKKYMLDRVQQYVRVLAAPIWILHLFEFHTILRERGGPKSLHRKIPSIAHETKHNRATLVCMSNILITGSRGSAIQSGPSVLDTCILWILLSNREILQNLSKTGDVNRDLQFF